MIRFDVHKLERERVRRGWKKSKLAKMVDVQPSTITAVFNGSNRSAETVKRICDELGLSIDEVMIEEQQPQDKPAPTGQHRVERRRASI